MLLRSFTVACSLWRVDIFSTVTWPKLAFQSLFFLLSLRNAKLYYQKSFSFRHKPLLQTSLCQKNNSHPLQSSRSSPPHPPPSDASPRRKNPISFLQGGGEGEWWPGGMKQGYSCLLHHCISSLLPSAPDCIQGSPIPRPQSGTSLCPLGPWPVNRATEQVGSSW